MPPSIVRLAADKVLLNDRDPVRWDESLRNAILQADLFRPNSPGICLPKGYVWGSEGWPEAEKFFIPLKA